MRIITHTCPECGTIIAGNVLEQHRRLKCPGVQCETVHQFSDLAAADRQHLQANLERYRMD